MNNLFHYLQQPIIGTQSLWQLIACASTILLAYFAGKIFRFLFHRRQKHYEKENAPMKVAIFQVCKKVVLGPLLVSGIATGIAFLTLGPQTKQLVDKALQILFILVIARVLFATINFCDASIQALYSKDKLPGLEMMLLKLGRRILKFVVIGGTAIHIIHIISGQPLTGILAGLGIGSLAIALAAQDSLKNFFGSLMILLDKPFHPGERIVLKGETGVVEDVGLRSTFIRTMDGHLVTIPNGVAANEVIRNITRRPFIRRILNVTITYDTPPEKVKEALQIIKDILAKTPEIQNPQFLPRVVFDDYLDSALQIKVIYWYFPADYWAFMAYNESFNHALLEQFNAAGIEFAFPSQTLYMVPPQKK